jgi:hypothetical protein
MVKFQPMPVYLHVYVPDTDVFYAQAVRRESRIAVPQGPSSLHPKRVAMSAWRFAPQR